MGFSRQEYWNGLPFPSPGNLPNRGIESRSPALQADALPSEPPGKPKHVDGATKTAEPWIRLDVSNPAWKPGVKACYPSSGSVSWRLPDSDESAGDAKAVLTVVQELPTQDVAAGTNRTKGGLPDASDEHILGVDTGNAVLCEAAQVLLQIEELRELQTKMKAAGVAVQAVLADPKTDHKPRGLWGIPGSPGHMLGKNHSEQTYLMDIGATQNILEEVSLVLNFFGFRRQRHPGTLTGESSI